MQTSNLLFFPLSGVRREVQGQSGARNRGSGVVVMGEKSEEVVVVGEDQGCMLMYVV